jgi:hypothetical protein
MGVPHPFTEHRRITLTRVLAKGDRCIGEFLESVGSEATFEAGPSEDIVPTEVLWKVIMSPWRRKSRAWY